MTPVVGGRIALEGVPPIRGPDEEARATGIDVSSVCVVIEDVAAGPVSTYLKPNCRVIGGCVVIQSIVSGACHGEAMSIATGGVVVQKVT